MSHPTRSCPISNPKSKAPKAERTAIAAARILGPIKSIAKEKRNLPKHALNRLVTKTLWQEPTSLSKNLISITRSWVDGCASQKATYTFADVFCVCLVPWPLIVEYNKAERSLRPSLALMCLKSLTMSLRELRLVEREQWPANESGTQSSCRPVRTSCVTFSVQRHGGEPSKKEGIQHRILRRLEKQCERTLELNRRLCSPQCDLPQLGQEEELEKEQ